MDKKIKVEVEFTEYLEIDKIVKGVSLLQNPQIITWFIGAKGLTQECFDFYRSSFISPLYQANSELRFWLFDLTAWNAFKNSFSSISKESNFCNIIESFSDNRIKCISSAKIFDKMLKITEKDTIDYLKKALKRNFIQKSSEVFPKTDIKINQLFPHNFHPLLQNLYEKDTNKSYSIFQYLEGCLLVDEIFNYLIRENSNNFQIIFILPNDELKYYMDEKNSFQRDVEFYINKKYPDQNECLLKIKFFSFKYGEKISSRPYNFLGKKLKKNEFLYQDLIGQKEQNLEPHANSF